MSALAFRRAPVMPRAPRRHPGAASFALSLSLPLLLAAAGCTSLQSVSVTQVPGDRSRPVHAEVSNTALFGIHFDNDFLADLTPQLLAQCPHGRITGLLTKQESSLYVIVATRRVIANGYCVYDAPLAQPTPSAPPGPPPVTPPPPPPAPAAAASPDAPSDARREAPPAVATEAQEHGS